MSILYFVLESAPYIQRNICPYFECTSTTRLPSTQHCFAWLRHNGLSNLLLKHVWLVSNFSTVSSVAKTSSRFVHNFGDSFRINYTSRIARPNCMNIYYKAADTYSQSVFRKHEPVYSYTIYREALISLQLHPTCFPHYKNHFHKNVPFNMSHFSKEKVLMWGPRVLQVNKFKITPLLWAFTATPFPLWDRKAWAQVQLSLHDVALPGILAALL